MNATPDWFHNAIVTGIQNLYLLSLPGSPAGEVLPGTVEVWVRSLWSMPIAWDERLDLPRIDAGFMHLAQTCDRWPAPKLLLANLPGRPAQLALAPPAHMPRPVPEKFRAVLMRLSGRLTMDRRQRDAADEAEAEAARKAADEAKRPAA